MLRSAAKNHEFVLPIVDPIDYPKVLELLRQGTIAPAVRREFAAKVFAHTADYDAAIAGYPDSEGGRAASAPRARDGAGAGAALRGESRRSAPASTSPRSRAACATSPSGRARSSPSTTCSTSTPRCGRWPAGATGRRAASSSTPRPAASPSPPRPRRPSAGPARPTRCRRSARSWRSTPWWTGPRRRRMADLFVEVVVAPSFHDEALAVFAAKKALRVVELPVSRGAEVARLQAGARRLPGPGPVRVRSLGRRVEGGDRAQADRPGVERPPLRLGGRGRGEVERHSARPRRAAIGIGAGQMSRVDSVFLAVHKARQQRHDDPRRRSSRPTGSFPSPTAWSRRRPRA